MLLLSLFALQSLPHILAFPVRPPRATGPAIGPVASLTIANKVISPDGFNRTAALAGGTVIGPLIVGNKVSTFVLEDQ